MNNMMVDDSEVDSFDDRSGNRRLAKVKILDAKTGTDGGSYVYLKFCLQAFVPLALDLGAGASATVHSGRAQVSGNRVLVSGDEENVISIDSHYSGMRDSMGGDGENAVYALMRCDEDTIKSAMPFEFKIPRDPVSVASDEIVPGTVYDSDDGSVLGRAVYHASAETLYTSVPFATESSGSECFGNSGVKTRKTVVFDDEDVILKLPDGPVTRGSASYDVGESVRVYFDSIRSTSTALPTEVLSKRVRYTLRDADTGIPLFNGLRRLMEHSFVKPGVRVVASFDASGLPLSVECPTASHGNPYDVSAEPADQDMGDVIVDPGDDTLTRNLRLAVIGAKTGVAMVDSREYEITLRNEDGGDEYKLRLDSDEKSLPVGVYTVTQVKSPPDVDVRGLRYGEYVSDNPTTAKMTLVSDGVVYLAIPEDQGERFASPGKPDDDRNEKSVYIELNSGRVASSGIVSDRCMDLCRAYGDSLKILDRVLVGAFHFDRKGRLCLMSRPLEDLDDPFAVNLKAGLSGMCAALKERDVSKLDPVFGCCNDRGNDFFASMLGPACRFTDLEGIDDRVGGDVSAYASSALARGIAECLLFMGDRVRRPVFNLCRVCKDDLPLTLRIVAGAMQRMQTVGVADYDVMIGARAVDEMSDIWQDDSVFCGGAPRPKSVVAVFGYLDGDRDSVEEHILAVSSSAGMPVQFAADDDCATEPSLLPPKFTDRYRRDPEEIGKITRSAKFAGTCVRHVGYGDIDDECWNSPGDDAIALDIPMPRLWSSDNFWSSSGDCSYRDSLRTFVRCNGELSYSSAKHRRHALNPYPSREKKEWNRRASTKKAMYLAPTTRYVATQHVRPPKHPKGCSGEYKLVIKNGNVVEVKRCKEGNKIH